MASDGVGAKILKQVEFYFSDSNLPKDKFLLEQTKQSPEGWVKIATIASFKRMKELTEDLNTVVAALKTSPELLEVKEDPEPVVRRRVALPDNIDTVITQRTVRVKGLPADSSIDSVTALIEPHAKVLAVRLQYYMETNPEDQSRKKKFKGAALVELGSKEQVDEIVKKQISIGDTQLILESMPMYHQRKQHKKRKDTPGGKEEKSEEKKEVEVPKDRVLSLSGAAAGTTREQVKELLEGAGFEPAYIEFTRESTSGYVRLASGSAAAAATALTGKQLNGVAVTVAALAGAEEEAYAEKVASKSKSKGGKQQRGGDHQGKKKRQKRD